jgi:NTP pyrophosphatase (non-canonical NTP hydrolase)
MLSQPASSGAADTAVEQERPHPRVVVCGTFRRAVDTLRRDFRALQIAGCDVLSPITVEFVAETDGFVLAEHELGRKPTDVERRHLEALQQADFVWLHAPDGYVGASAALELGVAHALGIPTFSQSQPVDSVLRDFVEAVENVEEAVNTAVSRGTHTPARPLDVLQDYYGRIATRRGYAEETAQDTMLLLTEEVGELARAVRKRVSLKRPGGYSDEDAGAELADIQLYLLHLANILDVRLASAVTQKERANARRPSAVAA